MITISVCMIVKNEEKVLARCLDSLRGVAEELIVVDTGSSDSTKEIAARYTDKIYDFTWVDDFSAARNFSFAKATKEYIYIADADEILEEPERLKFLKLKETLNPSVEMVQMLYTNQLEFGTTYNFDEELRPKLFKRQREFVWQDPLHETVRLEPVIMDSDIRVKHAPLERHSGRDFSIFARVLKRDGGFSEHLTQMYAKELMISGEEKDFAAAMDYFEHCLENAKDENALRRAMCVVVKGARLLGKNDLFFATALKNVALGKASSEVCFELGEYFFLKNNVYEAELWYYNAIYETEPEMDLKAAQIKPAKRLVECAAMLGKSDEAEKYAELVKGFQD